jgi:hypothetical protein
MVGLLINRRSYPRPRSGSHVQPPLDGSGHADAGGSRQAYQAVGEGSHPPRRPAHSTEVEPSGRHVITTQERGVGSVLIGPAESITDARSAAFFPDRRIGGRELLQDLCGLQRCPFAGTGIE